MPNCSLSSRPHFAKIDLIVANINPFTRVAYFMFMSLILWCIRKMYKAPNCRTDYQTKSLGDIFKNRWSYWLIRSGLHLDYRKYGNQAIVMQFRRGILCVYIEVIILQNPVVTSHAPWRRWHAAHSAAPVGQDCGATRATPPVSRTFGPYVILCRFQWEYTHAERLLRLT